MRLIDADALYELIDDGFDIDFDEVPETKAALLNMIDEQPTIEEQKTGKWIIEPYDTENNIWAHRCGNCLKVAMLGGRKPKFDFCPNCGADMRGEQDAEH